MPGFRYIVTVDCATARKAERVMIERILHEEEYGFNYMCDFERDFVWPEGEAEEPYEPCEPYEEDDEHLPTVDLDPRR